MVWGSSPLARGLRIRLRSGSLGRRIIPARAGFTVEDLVGARPTPDHPRSRGVYEVTYLLPLPVPGSSPLARGLQPRQYCTENRGRIIPARAGFTPIQATPFRRERDHPRSRGVYKNTNVTGKRPTGSSPLARGLHMADGSVGRAYRIIPARAGFTGISRGRIRSPPDHPRSRGVYLATDSTIFLRPGSSPLARGLRRLYRICARGLRIIPARAGFTMVETVVHMITGDHPRSRGVYTKIARSKSHSCGSSPLARGLHRTWRAIVNLPRIIPARAGFTADPQYACQPARDHPRSRGVYTT